MAPEALWLSLVSDLIWIPASLLLAWIVRNIQADAGPGLAGLALLSEPPGPPAGADDLRASIVPR